MASTGALGLAASRAVCKHGLNSYRASLAAAAAAAAEVIAMVLVLAVTELKPKL